MDDKNRLVAASDHLHYELWMLRLTAFMLRPESTGPPLGTSGGPGEARLVAYTHHAQFSEFTSNVSDPHLPEDEEEMATQNALLESFAIHLRQLLDFFYRTSKVKQDDVLAMDYFAENPELWSEAISELPEIDYQAIKDRVSQLVAHLTYKRDEILRTQRAWEVTEYKSHVLSVTRAFYASVDKSLLSDRWDYLPF